MTTQTRFSQREFRERFSRLQAKHRRLIVDAMGNPPDHRNIPKSLWQQIEKEEAAAYLILMLGVGLQSLQLHSRGIERKTDGAITQAELRAELQRQSVRRATWAARQTTGTVKRKVEDVIDRRPDATAQQVGDTIWTPKRRDRIVGNESVAATTNGATTVVAVAKKRKVEVFHIWRLGTCKHCEVCPLLDRTDQSYWGDVTSGPPLHVNCCCMTVIEFGTREELVRAGKLLARFPSQAQLLSAIRRSGWKL
jgi:hypothetical protein